MAAAGDIVSTLQAGYVALDAIVRKEERARKIQGQLDSLMKAVRDGRRFDDALTGMLQDVIARMQRSAQSIFFITANEIESIYDNLDRIYIRLTHQQVGQFHQDFLDHRVPKCRTCYMEDIDPDSCQQQRCHGFIDDRRRQQCRRQVGPDALLKNNKLADPHRISNPAVFQLGLSSPTSLVSDGLSGKPEESPISGPKEVS